jgi:hypothetical protein
MALASDTLSGTAAVVGAIAWPLVIAALIVALWRHLPWVVEVLARRLQSVSFMGVTAAFAQASAAPPEPVTVPSIKDPQPAAWLSSNLPALMGFLRRPGREDYAIVDLQQGRSWLTSRLYLFTSLLTRMRGIRCVVFLATQSPQKFVGMADPQQLLWSLAARQPWLEKAYAQALAKAFVIMPGEQNVRPTESNGSLDEMTATMLANNFLADPNIQQQVGASPWPSNESVSLPKAEPVTFEHATWLNPQEVGALLGNMLVTEPVICESADRSEREQIQTVIAHPPAPRQPAFVPVLDPNGQFLRLQDRTAIINAVAESALRLSTSR